MFPLFPGVWESVPLDALQSLKIHMGCTVGAFAEHLLWGNRTQPQHRRHESAVICDVS